MTKHLSQFHKCRGNPCYQYVNPYSVIVSEEREIYFLDMGAVSNEEELQNMQRRVVREYFLPLYIEKCAVLSDGKCLS